MDIKMFLYYHHDVRTTLTLDDDVAARLAAEARRTGRTFKDTVNDAIRGGLDAARHRPNKQKFEVRAKDLGGVRGHLQLHSVARLLDEVDGPSAQ